MGITAAQAVVGTKVKIPTSKKGKSHPDNLQQFHECLAEAEYTLPYLVISSAPFYGGVGLNFDKSVRRDLPYWWNLVVNSFDLEDLELFEA
jgi:hypothetical protein